MIDRVHRELTDDDIARIADTYHRWRGDGSGKYEDVPGFCMSATTEQIRSHQHVLTPADTSAPRRSRTTASPSPRR